MLDSLHKAGIEIVSPNFMNTRALAEGRKVIPAPSGKTSPVVQAQAENLAFDKAEEAGAIEKMRAAIERIDAQLNIPEGEEGAANEVARSALEAEKARLVEQLKAADEQMKAKELAEGRPG